MTNGTAMSEKGKYVQLLPVQLAVMIAAALLIVGIAAASISGQIGWERGDSYANWEAHFAHIANQKTMREIGTCRWAELAANCTFTEKHRASLSPKDTQP